MIDRARATAAMGALPHDPRLDELAARHARAMAEHGRTAHDLGDGDPLARLSEAELFPRGSGENVAHAATLALAHRALWTSPSHRLNLLDPRFRSLGVGVSLGADGSVWVAELFATRLPMPGPTALP
jgi:uncharacterized protein YkwD